MIGPARIYFSIAFPDIPSPIVDVWRMLVEHLSSGNAVPSKFILSGTVGHPPPHLKTDRDLVAEAKDVESLILKRGLNAFSVDTGYSERSVAYTLTHAKDLGRQSVLTCRIENKAKAPNDWSHLIERLMSRWPAVIGWQAFWPYVTWQIARKVSSFELGLGPLPPGYRTWHEPDPLGFGPGRTLIDTSLNPGRTKELLTKIHFYPTAEMWLGPHFWQYAKCTKEEALAADFFIEKRDTPHYLYLKCWPEPFTRPDGEQGRMQQRLWKLFFHEDCEWPPGSGGISDDPMYGPPELMPSKDGR